MINPPLSIQIAFLAGFAFACALLLPAVVFLGKRPREARLTPAEWDDAAREAWRELERRGLTGERSAPEESASGRSS